MKKKNYSKEEDFTMMKTIYFRTKNKNKKNVKPELKKLNPRGWRSIPADISIRKMIRKYLPR